MKNIKLIAVLALGAAISANIAPSVLAHGGAPHDAPKHEAKAQKVTVQIDGGYHPGQLKVHAGREVQLTLVRKEAGGCGDTVKFAELTETVDGKEVLITRTLKTGESTTISFTPSAKGTLHFTCGMGMYKGAILVK